MGGDFVIGLIIFAILVTVNFVVITKGATRIAEVGARFTLDAIPGKQMAIDADLSAGLIDDKEAQRRRRELEEESAFFGAMDGASKFVRGDAIAGLIITAINIFGGIIIGVTHHGLTLAQRGRRLHQAVRRRRSGDADAGPDRVAVGGPPGLQGRHQGVGGAGRARQLGGYPRAVSAAALMMFVLALMPGLPLVPFALLGGVMAFVGYSLPRRQAARGQEGGRRARRTSGPRRNAKESVKELLKTRRSSCRSAAICRSICWARIPNLRTGSARSAENLPSNTASSFRRSSSATICRSIPRDTRSGSTTRVSPMASSGSARCWCSSTRTASPTCPAKR